MNSNGEDQLANGCGCNTTHHDALFGPDHDTFDVYCEKTTKLMEELKLGYPSRIAIHKNIATIKLTFGGQLKLYTPSGCTMGSRGQACKHSSTDIAQEIKDEVVATLLGTQHLKSSGLVNVGVAAYDSTTDNLLKSQYILSYSNGEDAESILKSDTFSAPDRLDIIPSLIQALGEPRYSSECCYLSASPKFPSTCVRPELVDSDIDRKGTSWGDSSQDPRSLHDWLCSTFKHRASSSSPFVARQWNALASEIDPSDSHDELNRWYHNLFIVANKMKREGFFVGIDDINSYVLLHRDLCAKKILLTKDPSKRNGNGDYGYKVLQLWMERSDVCP